MILIIGARSKIGSQLAQLLHERREPVRVIMRGGEPAAQLRSLGVEIAVGDLAQPGI